MYYLLLILQCIFLLPSYLFTLFFFFFNATATTEIYTLSLHDALPISFPRLRPELLEPILHNDQLVWRSGLRSEEHTSELQSRFDLVCRLLLEKKKKKKKKYILIIKNNKSLVKSTLLAHTFIFVKSISY